jgi:hypothetical protein
VADPASYYAALDEIIKYNNKTNEFNYLQELYHRMKGVIDDPTRLSSCSNWNDLYNVYDQDNSSQLNIIELTHMMSDAGMKYCTDAESKFVHDYISQGSETITPITFVNWANSFRGLP